MPPAADCFRTHATQDGMLVVHEAFEDAVRALRFPDPDAVRACFERGDGTPAHGRGATAVIGLPDRPERVHLRPVRHGGVLGPLWGARILGPGRPIAELRTTEALRARGAPVPQAVLVAAWRTRPLWSAVVGGVHVEGARDALAWLHGHPAAAILAAVATRAGRAVRAFHDAGGRHADLHVKNLLVEPEGAGERVWVIDLDRARAGAPPPPRRRMVELMRLYRSLLKRGVFEQVGAEGRSAFFAAYTGGDEALERALMAHWPRERRRVARHVRAYRDPG